LTKQICMIWLVQNGAPLRMKQLVT